MVTYENECVGCPPHMGCDGDLCKYRNVPHCFCDECNEEVEQLYSFDGYEMCLDCIEKMLIKIEV